MKSKFPANTGFVCSKIVILATAPIDKIKLFPVLQKKNLLLPSLGCAPLQPTFEMLACFKFQTISMFNDCILHCCVVCCHSYRTIYLYSNTSSRKVPPLLKPLTFDKGLKYTLIKFYNSFHKQ